MSLITGGFVFVSGEKLLYFPLFLRAVGNEVLLYFALCLLLASEKFSVKEKITIH